VHFEIGEFGALKNGAPDPDHAGFYLGNRHDPGLSARQGNEAQGREQKRRGGSSNVHDRVRSV